MEDFFYYCLKSDKDENITVKADIPNFIFRGKREEEYFFVFVFHCDDDILHIVDVEINKVKEFYIHIGNAKLFLNKNKQMITNVDNINNVRTLVYSKNKVDRVSIGDFHGIIATTSDDKFEIHLLQDNETIKSICEHIPISDCVSKVTKLVSHSASTLDVIKYSAEFTITFGSFLLEIDEWKKSISATRDGQNRVLVAQTKAFDRMKKAYKEIMESIILCGELKFEKKRIAKVKTKNMELVSKIKEKTEKMETLRKQIKEQEKIKSEKEKIKNDTRFEEQKREYEQEKIKNDKRFEEQKLLNYKRYENDKIKQEIINTKKIKQTIEKQLDKKICGDGILVEVNEIRKMREKFEDKMDDLMNGQLRYEEV